jgi:hypothetical protein
LQSGLTAFAAMQQTPCEPQVAWQAIAVFAPQEAIQVPPACEQGTVPPHAAAKKTSPTRRSDFMAVSLYHLPW